MLNRKRNLQKRPGKRAMQCALFSTLVLGSGLPTHAQTRIAPQGALPASPWSHRSDNQVANEPGSVNGIVNSSSTLGSNRGSATVIRQPRSNTVSRRSESIRLPEPQRSPSHDTFPSSRDRVQATRESVSPQDRMQESYEAEVVPSGRPMRSLLAPIPSPSGTPNSPSTQDGEQRWSSSNNFEPREDRPEWNRPQFNERQIPSSDQAEPVVPFELTPAYDDSDRFTQRATPSRSNESARWQSLPSSGIQLASDPNEVYSGPGLADRQEKSSGSWNPALQNSANANNAAGTNSPYPNSAQASQFKNDPNLEYAGQTRAPQPAVSAPFGSSPAPVILQQPASEADRIAREQDANRQRYGKLVSQEIMAERSDYLEEKPPAIEPPEGWRSIELQMKKHLKECDELLRRNATLSARQEVLQAMRLLLRSLDQRQNSSICERHMDLALQAFKEEADFHSSIRSPQHSVLVSNIVAGHQTPVLKGAPLVDVAPATAAQWYRHYAKDQLVIAAGQNANAADLYYAYGKCLEKMASESENDRAMYLGQASACYMAALNTAPNQLDAANQLGFVLLELDRSSEAEIYLNHSLRLHPTPTAYQNLAEMYARRGDVAGREWAIKSLAAIAPQAIQPQRAQQIVQEVDPATFVKLSPYNPAQQFPVTNGGAQPMMQTQSPQMANGARTGGLVR